MKKRLVCGATAALMLISFLGCSSEQQSGYRKASPSIDVSKNPNVADARGGEGECSSDADCGLIPDPPEKCIPCVNGAGQKAVTKNEGKATMGPLKDTCKPQMQQFMEAKGQGYERTKSEACGFETAVCEAGVCVPGKLTEAQKQQMKQASEAPQSAHEAARPSTDVRFENPSSYPTGDAWGTTPTTGRTPFGYDRLGQTYPTSSPFNAPGYSASNYTNPGAPYASTGYGSAPIAPRYGASSYGTHGFNSSAAYSSQPAWSSQSAESTYVPQAAGAQNYGLQRMQSYGAEGYTSPSSSAGLWQPQYGSSSISYPNAR